MSQENVESMTQVNRWVIHWLGESFSRWLSQWLGVSHSVSQWLVSATVIASECNWVVSECELESEPNSKPDSNYQWNINESNISAWLIEWVNEPQPPNHKPQWPTNWVLAYPYSSNWVAASLLIFSALPLSHGLFLEKLHRFSSSLVK